MNAVNTNSKDQDLAKILGMKSEFLAVAELTEEQKDKFLTSALNCQKREKWIGTPSLGLVMLCVLTAPLLSKEFNSSKPVMGAVGAAGLAYVVTSVADRRKFMRSDIENIAIDKAVQSKKNISDILSPPEV